METKKYLSYSEQREGSSISKSNLADLVNELSNVLQRLESLTTSANAKHPKLLKKLDLLEFLNAEAYSVSIHTDFCDIKDIIRIVQNCYEKLTCTQPDCQENAIMYLKANDDTPAELFCDSHIKSSNHSTGELTDIETAKKKTLSKIESLEKMLILLQEHFGYTNYQENHNTDFSFDKLQNIIKDDFESLREDLNQFTEKVKHLENLATEDESLLRYESFSFISEYFKRSLKRIKSILKKIYSMNIKFEVESKINAILDSTKVQDFVDDDEPKHKKFASVPEDIYSNTKLCKIPVQNYNKLMDLAELVAVVASQANKPQKVLYILHT